MKKVKLEFNLPVIILKEGKSFIAYTPALDLSTSGKDLKEAKERFSEIADIFFEEIIKEGKFEKVLKNLGWKKSRTKWNPPVIVSQESQNIKVCA